MLRNMYYVIYYVYIMHVYIPKCNLLDPYNVICIYVYCVCVCLRIINGKEAIN